MKIIHSDRTYLALRRGDSNRPLEIQRVPLWLHYIGWLGVLAAVVLAGAR
jgi:hypothetical protein